MVWRTIARGGRPRPGPSRHYLPSGRRTDPDGYFSGLFDNGFNISEAKFKDGKLTVPQQEAMQRYGQNYRLDKFLPRDLAVALGLPIANLASAEVRDGADRLSGQYKIESW